MGRERIAHRLGWVKPMSQPNRFTSRRAGARLRRIMTRQTGILIIFLAALLLGGCARATLTNLTVGQMPRNKATGLYRVEIRWENNANGVRHETVQPVVLVGANVFPMKRVAVLTNDWSALVPVAADAAGMTYRVKVNWEFSAIPVPEANSKMSKSFQLQIKD